MTVGIGTYGAEHIQVRGQMNNISIGKYCSIGVGLVIDGGFNHRTNCISTYPFKRLEWTENEIVFAKGDVNIGNDVWIGEGCLVMSGVTIGSGAVIGARSIVTKSIPPYTIVAGSPAKIIKKRFSDTQIQDLLNIAWWDWSEEKIKSLADHLNGKSPENWLKILNEFWRCNS